MATVLFPVHPVRWAHARPRSGYVNSPTHVQHVVAFRTDDLSVERSSATSITTLCGTTIGWTWGKQPRAPLVTVEARLDIKRCDHCDRRLTAAMTVYPAAWQRALNSRAGGH